MRNIVTYAVEVTLMHIDAVANVKSPHAQVRRHSPVVDPNLLFRDLGKAVLVLAEFFGGDVELVEGCAFILALRVLYFLDVALFLD